MFSSTLSSFVLGASIFCGSVTALPGSGPFHSLNYNAKVGDKGRIVPSNLVDIDNSKSTVPSKTSKDDTSGFQFYNTNTAPYLVQSLPDVPFAVGEMYSGNLPITAGDTSRQLFFIFQPTVGTPVKELTIWFNGGPGCSSIEGFFQENGLFVWREGNSKPGVNKQSWVNQTNMLWIEQPIGVGYSIGTPTATTEEGISQDIIGFLTNFMTLFGISGYKTLVTGESYAGRYVPYVASAILDQTDKTMFSLGGALIYDGCIGSFTTTQENIPAYPFVVANNDLLKFSSSQLKRLKTQHTTCGYDKTLSTYLTFPPPGHQPVASTPLGCDTFNSAYNTAKSINSCFNIYEINQTCPTPFDPMSDDYFSQPDGSKTNYFNRADVKSALHAPADSQWSECSNNPVFLGGGGSGGPEGEGDLSADPIQYVLPKVIQATNRVLISNGGWDMVIITNGSLLAIQNMTWGGNLGFQSKPSTPITINGVQHGIQHQERGLMWAETFKAGHMGPQYDPDASLRHLEWVRGTINSL